MHQLPTYDLKLNLASSVHLKRVAQTRYIYIYFNPTTHCQALSASKMNERKPFWYIHTYTHRYWLQRQRKHIDWSLMMWWYDPTTHTWPTALTSIKSTETWSRSKLTQTDTGSSHGPGRNESWMIQAESDITCARSHECLTRLICREVQMSEWVPNGFDRSCAKVDVGKSTVSDCSCITTWQTYWRSDRVQVCKQEVPRRCKVVRRVVADQWYDWGDFWDGIIDRRLRSILGFASSSGDMLTSSGWFPLWNWSIIYRFLWNGR